MYKSFSASSFSLDFMGKRKFGFLISAILICVSIALFFVKGLNYGIDFTGGILIEMRSSEEVPLASLRQALGKEAFGEVSLQHFGSKNDVMIRIQTHENEAQAEVVSMVKKLIGETLSGEIDYRKIDYVGPTVGQELIESGMWSLLCVIAVIMMYIWVRFEWQYGLGAVLALIHDGILTIGFFAATQFDFGLPAVAAILTIIGYSINDSVVIFDRIRENLRRFKTMNMDELLNRSINNTLSRTILTGLTTLLAALALALFGGDVLRGFSWAIVFGVIVGTYSSIYIGSPVLIHMNLRREQEAEAPGGTVPAEK